MCGLKICLWIAAILCLLSVVGLLLPVSTWEPIARCFGIESLSLSGQPLFEYRVRLTSAITAVIGIYLIILALDPVRYGIMVPLAGSAAVLLGAVCVIAGLVSAMPALWFLGDSIYCTIWGIVILAFWRRARQTSHQNQLIENGS